MVKSDDYQGRVDAVFRRLEHSLEVFDPDELDYSTSDGVLRFDFADGTRFVLNRQSAVEELWFAAGVEAWHFAWDGARGVWRDVKRGDELFARLASSVAAKLGRAVGL
jgi:CyaY protein